MNDDNLPESILKTRNGEAMPLERVSVKGTLRDLAAEITVEQHYRNPRSTNIEAIYTFPLPMGAVLLDLELDIGDRHLVGQVVEKKEAQERYEDAVTDGDTAVMIEITGPGLYTLNFGNLMAGESAVIRYRYTVLLNWQGDRVRLLLPTTLAPRYGDPVKAGLAPHQTPETSLLAEYPFDLSLSIEGQLSQGEISCPSHTISIVRNDTGLNVTLANQAVLDRDFVLVARGTRESSACVFAKDGSENIILASIRVPPIPKKEEKPLRLKIVIDCSGSMAGMSIVQARKAALEILNQLRPGDRFNFSLFGNNVQHFWSDLVPAEARYISKAWKKLENLNAGMGGTETGNALRAVYAIGKKPSNALSKLKDHLRPEKDSRKKDEPDPQILLITDGEVWDYKAIVKDAGASHHRVFTVGVGLSVAEGLVSELAKQTGGACELVSPQEGMTDRILTQFHRMRQPRITIKGINLGVKPNWFTPLSKSVFAGDTLHVFVGVTGETPNLASLTGEDAHGNAFSIDAKIETSDWIDLPRMAAAARISSPKTSEEDKLKLALEHRLLTEQTNLLIIAERDEKAEQLPELAKVAHMLAAGWGGTGVGDKAIVNACNDVVPAIFMSGRAPGVRFSLKANVDRYDIPCFLRKSADSADDRSNSTVLFDLNGIEIDSGLSGDTPHDFIANLHAGLPNFQNPESIPVLIEVLEDYGLPTVIANALREIYSEGWPERTIVAAFLMTLSKARRLSSAFPRELSRLIFASWKRTDMNPALLERIEEMIEDVSAKDWQFDTSKNVAEPVAP